MAAVELSVQDHFIELGNRFFNVETVEWKNEHDLSYESSSTDPVNRYFIEGEERLNFLFDLFLEMISHLLGILNFNKKIKNENRNNKLQLKNYKSQSEKFVIRKYTNNRALNTVTQYNVSKTLINKLNEDLRKIDMNKSSNRIIRNQKKIELKNQFRNKHIEDNYTKRDLILFKKIGQFFQNIDIKNRVLN